VTGAGWAGRDGAAGRAALDGSALLSVVPEGAGRLRSAKFEVGGHRLPGGSAVLSDGGVEGEIWMMGGP
jgi:hypothetical protein